MVKVNRPKKAYGQHFINSAAIIQRITAFARPTPGEVIVEIGPGTGALTEALVQSGARVIAVEVDPDLVPLLRQAFQSDPHLRVVQADILKTDIAALAQEIGLERQSLRIMGNLPYNIATQVIQRLLEEKEWLRDMTIMIQKEVADRLTAQPGTKDYGYLTALVQYHTAIRPGFAIAPGSFSPPPKVWSSLIQLTVLPQPPWPAVDYALYQELLKAVFAHRRKTILNNLKRAPRFQSTALDALRACRIEPERRAESLPVRELVALANDFQALGV